MVGVNAENRQRAKIAGGEEVDVGIQLDIEPRDVTLPSDTLFQPVSLCLQVWFTRK
jgi:hypothetical protein